MNHNWDTWCRNSLTLDKVNCGFNFLFPQLLAGFTIWTNMLILQSNLLWTRCMLSSEAARLPVPPPPPPPPPPPATSSTSTETMGQRTAKTIRRYVTSSESRWLKYIERRLESKWESNKLSPSSFASFSPTSISLNSFTYTNICLCRVLDLQLALLRWLLQSFKSSTRSIFIICIIPWYNYHKHETTVKMIGSLCLTPVVLLVPFQLEGFFVVLSKLDFTLEVIFHPNFNTFHYLPLQGSSGNFSSVWTGRAAPTLCRVAINQFLLRHKG